MSGESYFRPEVPVTVPDDLRALQDDINETWRRLALIGDGYAPPPVTLRLGPDQGCQPPLLHTYRREDEGWCQCGEREWPAELQDD